MSIGGRLSRFYKKLGSQKTENGLATQPIKSFENIQEVAVFYARGNVENTLNLQDFKPVFRVEFSDSRQ